MSIRVACLCGNVAIELSGEPVARANCHCSSCRDFYGVAMFSATAWEASSVQMKSAEVRTFSHPEKQLKKTFCTSCGEVVFGTNRLGMRVVPNAMLARAAREGLDVAVAPTMHLYYRQRVIEVLDELPKYLDGWDGPTYQPPAA
ncbi:aldehyde-activating protein [Stenotrophomonas maltophilia]|nr:aldehyde-activating protein [Stenotrophomonas maltophilia]NMT71837.1 aldehyde-activating protein [Stenotrophomonas maltophilia]